MTEYNQQERDILEAFFQFERRFNLSKVSQILFERMFYED